MPIVYILQLNDYFFIILIQDNKFIESICIISLVTLLAKDHQLETSKLKFLLKEHVNQVWYSKDSIPTDLFDGVLFNSEIE